MTTPTDGKVRLGGLTSGFDTQTIIQQLLAVEQSKVDSLQENKDLNVAKMDTWEDLASQLKDFGQVVQKLKGDVGTSLYEDKEVDSTISSVATATASRDAELATYEISVTNLALSNVAYGSAKASNYTLPTSGTITVGGASIALTAGDSLQDIADTINSATFVPGNDVIATVISNRLVFQTAATGISATIHGTTAGSPPFNNATDDPDNILETELGMIDNSGELVNESQPAQSAAYTINGITISSETNTISDVINDVTFKLNAAGSTTLKVETKTDAIKETLVEFVTLYNEIRDYVDRVRNAKLSDDEQFGMFFSDPMLRGVFSELRRFSTQGVRMGGDDWNGSVVTQGAAAIGDTSLTLDSFTAGTGNISQGDEFTIAGDKTIYRIVSDTTIAGNQATVSIDPPLVSATTGGEAIAVAYRTIEDLGIGIRTDTVSGVEGIMGLLDEGKLDNLIESDLSLLQRILGRSGDNPNQEGVATRLFDWIDNYTKLSVIGSKKRLIDDIKMTSLEDLNERIDDQIARLEARMKQKEEILIRQFANMENALSQAQSAGQAVASLGGGAPS